VPDAAVPAVLIVEDDVALREALSTTLEGSGRYPVLAAASGPEALSILDRERVGLVVSDVQMEPMDGHELLSEMRRRHPALPAVLMTAYGTIEHAVTSIRQGASDYLAKPFEAGEFLELVERHMQCDTGGGPVACDPATLELLRIAERVAKTDATVTLSGESGCGKEVFARFIHERSPRRERPFVAINCAAIPENMLEAVLFGHEKGAFTGAVSAHAGKFEQAEGGTLLLDEVSEMDLGLQAKLLRVIQEREVERLGGRRTIPLDVRVLATTNRNLRTAVTEGRFREDLYYRLNVFPLAIPPLRERPGDILPLAEFAIARHHAGPGSRPVVDAGARKALEAHDWPGNVRELENTIQRSLILLQGSCMTAADLAFEAAPAEARATGTGPADLQDEVRQHEYGRILEALKRHAGRRAEAAKALGISPRTLRYKLARMREDGVFADEPLALNA